MTVADLFKLVGCAQTPAQPDGHLRRVKRTSRGNWSYTYTDSQLREFHSWLADYWIHAPEHFQRLIASNVEVVL